MERYDFAIIGGGPAGMAAAVKADALGAKTVMVEKDDVVGGSGNTGSAPTKNLLRVGEVIHIAKQKNLQSVTGRRRIGLNFKEVVYEAREAVATLRKSQYDILLGGLRNLSRVKGEASFTSPFEFTAGGRTIAADKFLIASGSIGAVPPIDGLAEAGFFTNLDILNMSEPPRSLIVLGGGPLGLEFAQMFAHFGSAVRVIQRSREVLPRVEPEIAAAAREYLEDEGIAIHTSESVIKVEKEGDRRLVTVKSIGLDHRYRTDQILLAVGRRANTGGLGLENTGVEVDAKGAVVVDDELITSVAHIYAAGDAKGEPMLENVAVREGEIAAENALTGANTQMDYDTVPMCAFIHPEVAQVGQTEAAALSRGHVVESAVVEFKNIARALITRNPRGKLKMVMEKGTRRILGCAIVADHAGELINEAALAVAFKLSVDDIRDTIHVYPTLAEAIPRAAAAFKPDAALSFGAIEPQEKAA